jgi:hypothetical protein
MIADTLRYFQFEVCNHIPLLQAMHKWACNTHHFEYQVKALKRLQELGASPWPKPQIRLVYDADQRDYDEEAAAHGVSTRELLR